MADNSTPPRPFSSFKVLTFDCYGTLVDWSTGMLSALRHIPGGVPESELLELFNSIEAHMFISHQEMPYDQILYKTYDLTAERLGIESSPDPSECSERIFTGRGKIARNENWPAFPDSADALNALKKIHGYKLVVLSNITVEMFEKTMQSALKGARFDAVYTAEEIGSYKPAEQNFEYLLKKVEEKFGAQKDDILHVAHGISSDHVPCKKMGINSCWIRRGDEEVDAQMKDDVAFGWTFDTMKDLLDAVEKEKQERA